MSSTRRLSRLPIFYTARRRFSTKITETLDTHKFTKEWRNDAVGLNRGFATLGLCASVVTVYFETLENANLYALECSIPSIERSLFLVTIWTLGAASRNMLVTSRNATMLLKGFIASPIINGGRFGFETALWTLGYGCFFVGATSIGFDLRYRYRYRSLNLAEGSQADESVINFGNTATMGATTATPSAAHGSAESFTEIVPDSSDGDFVESKMASLPDEDDEVEEYRLPDPIDFDINDLLLRTAQAVNGFAMCHAPVFLFSGLVGGSAMVRFSWARWKIVLDRCRTVSVAGSVVRA